MGEVNRAKSTESELLMLAIELRAIRDRVVGDLDAALAKVERSLPPPADTAQIREMRSWTTARWRQFYQEGRG